MYPLSAALPGKPKSTDQLLRLHPRTYGCPGCSPSLGRTLHQRHKKQNCKRRWHKRRQRNRIFYRMYPSLLLLPKFSNQSRAPGKGYHCQKLSAVFLSLQQQGAYNINLVTPTQFLPHIVRALEISRPELTIPVIYNCGGYERTEIIDALKDKVQIYMPDLKYFSPVLSKRYSQAENYFSVASRAVLRMIEQTGPPLFDPQTGLLKRGVLLRHMVLPGAREDSIKLLHWIKNHLPEKGFLISLMSQYTPFYQAKNHPEINRRITTYEYQKVIDEALRLGLTDGFMQEKSSAREEYTPPFSTLEGL